MFKVTLDIFLCKVYRERCKVLQFWKCNFKKSNHWIFGKTSKRKLWPLLCFIFSNESLFAVGKNTFYSFTYMFDIYPWFSIHPLPMVWDMSFIGLPEWIFFFWIDMWLSASPLSCQNQVPWRSDNGVLTHISHYHSPS